MITITPIPAFNDNYIWLLVNPVNASAVAVDPGDATPVLDYLTQHQLHLSGLLVTHHHRDHCGGVTTLLSHYAVPVFAPATENIAGTTHPVKTGTIVTLPTLELTFQVLDIPAHTRGHVAYYNDAWVFCGDTLFTAGCGRLFEGTAEQMYHALSQLAALPAETEVYCGHEYTEANLRFATTVEPKNADILERIAVTQQLRAQGKPTVPASLALEKRTNPFLRCEVPEVIAAASAHAQTSLKTPVDVLRVLRLWKDQF